MRRFLAFLFLCFTVVACAAVHPPDAKVVGPGPEEPSAEVLKIASDTVALVYHGRPFCSAVWIGPAEILTANHCIEGLAEMQSEDTEGEVPPEKVLVTYMVQREVKGVGQPPMSIHMAYVEKLSPSNDLALLYAEGGSGVIPKHTFAKVARREPAVGSHLRIMGHQVGLYWSLQEGVVAAYRDTFEGPAGISGPFMQVAANVWFGNSGGGAFNENGDLVGIASFLMKGPALTFFIPADTIQAFLTVP